MSLRQRIVPDALLGRVNASYRLLAWGRSPSARCSAGSSRQAFGLPAVFLIAGVSTTACCSLARAIVTDAAIAAAEREGAADAARLAATDAPAEATGSA